MQGINPKFEIEFKKILKTFNDDVAKYCEPNPYRNFRVAHTDFPIFKPANEEFRKYQYFEKWLCHKIRENLVNDVLYELFRAHGLRPLWFAPEKNYGLTSNENLENIIPFEFIVTHKNKTVGYRYTHFNGDGQELSELKNEYSLDAVNIVRWSDDSRRGYRVENDIELQSVLKIEEITIRDLFEEYFSENEYDYCISNICNAVEKANEYIGFQTIPRLSFRNSTEFKIDILDDLRNYSIANKSYEIINPDDNKTKCFYHLEHVTLSEKDIATIDNTFKTKGLYKALVGNEEFAKCFVTAEYLFSVFSDKDSFEYTSIVCGYLKAVEQLLYKLLKINIQFFSDEEMKIRNGKTYHKVPKTKLPRYVTDHWEDRDCFMTTANSANEKYFDITMDALIYFLFDNEVFWSKLDMDKRTLTEFLLCYKTECRNEHFHKDNIDDFIQVKKIRNNTLYIIALILGACRFTDDIQKDLIELKAFDDTYYRFFKAMSKIPMHRYYIKFNGKEEIKAIRVDNMPGTPYTNYDRSTDNSMMFIIVDEFKPLDDDVIFNVAPENMLLIDEHNIPEKIWFWKPRNGRGEIYW